MMNTDTGRRTTAAARTGVLGVPIVLVLCLSLCPWTSAASNSKNDDEGAPASAPAALQEEGQPQRPLNILIVCLPFQGHFLPVKAIAEQLVLRGHKATALIENTGWCDGPVSLNCIKMPNSGTFPPEFFGNLSLSSDTMSPLFDEIGRHHKEQLGNFLEKVELLLKGESKFDLLLMDASTVVGFGIAHKFSIPYAVVYPLVLRQAVGVESWIPLLGSGQPRDLSFLQRWLVFSINFLLPMLSLPMLNAQNAVRAAHGIRPFRSLAEINGIETLFFTPTIWGYDIAQPYCRTVQPMGTASPLLQDVPIEPELDAFLLSDTCSAGAIYVNFGTLSKQTDAQVQKLFDAFMALEFCIVWKVIEEDRRQRFTEQGKETGRFYISKRFASPIAIMAHRRVAGFLTHCGGTSVGEAVIAQVPLMGIPFFADQLDVCQRMDEAGFGRYVGHHLHFTPQQVISAARALAENRTYTAIEKKETEFSSSSYLRALYQTRKMAETLGGPQKAAETLETHIRKGLLGNPNEDPHPYTCQEVVVASPCVEYGYFSYPIYIGLFVLVFSKLLQYFC